MATPTIEEIGTDAELARTAAARLAAELEQHVVAEHAAGATVSAIARAAKLTRHHVYAILRRNGVEIDSERGRRLVAARHRPIVLVREAPVEEQTAFWERENQRIDGTTLISEAAELLAEPDLPEMDYLGFIDKMRREAAIAGYND
jgi:hypothetical protein